MISMIDTKHKPVTELFFCIWCGTPLNPAVPPGRDLAHVRECILPHLLRAAYPTTQHKGGRNHMREE